MFLHLLQLYGFIIIIVVIFFFVFYFGFRFQLQQPKLKEVFAWHSIVFLFLYFADHQNCINKNCCIVSYFIFSFFCVCYDFF